MHDFPYFPQRGDDDELDVAGLLMRGLRSTAADPLLVFEGQPWSAPRIAAAVAAAQRQLAARGLGRGDRVAVMLRNSPEHVALIYALILAGLVWVPVNTRLKSAGLRYLVEHARPRLVVAEDEYLPQFDGIAAAPVVGPFDLAEAGADALPRREAVGPFDTLCLIYTSGTTGAPKGVQFTHRMLRIATEAALMVADGRPDDRLFLWEPLCHVGGAQMLLAPFLVPLQLHVHPGFSASRFWAQVAASRATQLHYLGGVLEILMRQSGGIPANTLRTVWGAGLNRETWHAVHEAFDVDVRECYGMTECASFATVNTDRRPGSIGRPLPWIDLELLDEHGAPVPAGAHGEIVLTSRVPGTFLTAYLDNPEATAQALRGGRLHTGDAAWRDVDGYLHFVGRRTDSMRVRGENVSAWEVERVFAQHPGLAASAAVGVTSDIGEQEILIYLQAAAGVPERVAARDLAAWAGERLASFQLPRFYKWVDRFELTPSERIRKHLLPRDTGDAWDLRAPA